MYEHQEFDRPAYQEATRIYREELRRARFPGDDDDIRHWEGYTCMLKRVAREHGERSEVYAAGLYYLASYLSEEAPAKALPVWLQLLNLERTLYGPLSEDVAGTLNNIGLHLMDETQRKALGEAFLRLALAVHAKAPSNPGHPEFQLAQTLSQAGQAGRSLAWAQSAAGQATDAKLRGTALHTLAMDRWHVGDWAGAEDAFREAHACLRDGKEPEQRSNSLYNCARLLMAQHRWAEARSLLEESLKVERKRSSDDAELWAVLRMLVQVCGAQGDTDALCRYAIAWLQSVEREGSQKEMAQAAERLDELARGTGKPRLRYAALSAVAAKVKTVPVQQAFARCAWDQGRHEEAEAALKRALERAGKGSLRPQVCQELARLYVDTGRPREAEALARELEDAGLAVLAQALELQQGTIQERPLWKLLEDITRQEGDAARAAEED